MIGWGSGSIPPALKLTWHLRFVYRESEGEGQRESEAENTGCEGSSLTAWSLHSVTRVSFHVTFFKKSASSREKDPAKQGPVWF